MTTSPRWEVRATTSASDTFRVGPLPSRADAVAIARDLIADGRATQAAIEPATTRPDPDGAIAPPISTLAVAAFARALTSHAAVDVARASRLTRIMAENGRRLPAGRSQSDAEANAEEAALARLAAYFRDLEAHYTDPARVAVPSDPHVRRFLLQLDAGAPLDDALDAFIAVHEPDDLS